MASASVVDHLHLEALPLIDLRLLSQSELYSLSLCSSSSYSSNDNDDVLIPKIDRSVFNESAGSRKQTYSRLRLAPRKPQSTSAPAPTPTPTRTRTPFSSTPRQIPEPLDEENYQIISLLKQLFAASETPSTADDDDNLVSVRIEYEEALPDWSSGGFQNVPIDVLPVGEQKRKRGRPRKDESWRIEPYVPVDVVFSEGEKKGKRKRGRPRKEENLMIENRLAVVEEKDMVMVAKNGDMADLAALANVDDPYGEELKRRTEGLQTEAELLGFLSGLPGESVNRSRKRRIVVASDFGDVLPEGWKLMLTVKKRASRVWLHCRRYISPNGHQFVSCKEVSSYLLSFFELQDASRSRSGHIDENVQLARKMDLGDDAAFKLEDGKNADDLVSCSPLPMTSILTDYAKQDTLKTGDPGVQTEEILKCHKCNITFDEKNDLAHHLISAHNIAANCVIIKDGKYECKLCHKRFDERQQSDGHFGVHLQNYVKSVDVSGEVISNQKHLDPSLARVLLSTSKRHKSIGIDKAKTSFEAIDEPSSGFRHDLIKADSIIKTCGDMDSHALVLISHDKETIKADKDDKALVKEHSDKQDKIWNMNNDNLGKVDVAPVAVDRWNACSVNETASVNENRSICESSYKRNLHECIHSGINSKVAESSSESSLLAPPGNDRTLAVGDNVIKVSFPSVVEPQPEIGSECGLLALNRKDKTCSGEDIEGYTSENNESASAFRNHDNGLKDVCTNFKQPRCSDGCSIFPFKNEQRSTLVNNGSGILSSPMFQSVHERGSASGLCSSSTVEKRCVVRGNLNYVFTSALDEPRFDEVNISGKNVFTVGFGSNHASQTDKAVTSSDREGSSGSCLLISSCNEHRVVENNANKNPSWTPGGPFQEKTFESHMFTSSVNEQISGFDNNMEIVSTGAVEGLKLDDVRNRKNHELNIVFDRNETGVDADTSACSQQEKFFKSSLLVSSADEHRYVLKDYDICNNTMEELKQVRGASERGLLGQSGCKQNLDNINNVKKVSSSSIEEAKHKKVKSFWNTEVFLACGTREGIDADVTGTTQEQSSEGCSLALSGNEQTFSSNNKLTDVYSSTVGDLKHESDSKNSFPCPSAFDQIENKSNGVYMSSVWEWHRSEDMEKPRDDELMIDFGDLVQSNEDSMTEPTWRTTEQNIRQSGLASTSSPLMQSSGCFPHFDLMSSKGGDKFFSDDRFDRKEGLEGLRSSRTGNPEHNFLTLQGSSHPEESKVLSYDVEMEGLDSSYWLKKEALPLLPKLASRHQVRTVCVWCRNEFYQESVNSEMQSGSVGFMCATCNSKYSRQVNLL